MTETTKTRQTQASPDDRPRVGPPDRGLGLFLRIGTILLVVGLVGFGVFYVVDQRVVAPPSIADQQISKAEQAVRQNPNDVQARLSLALAYEEKNRLDEALTQYNEILKVAPDTIDATMGRGHALFTKGDLSGAAADYAKVVGAQRSGEFAGADKRLEVSYYYLGAIALKQGQPVVAMEQLRRALSIAPTDSDALYQVGLAQAAMGSHKDAIATFRKALTFVPTGWCDPYQQAQASFTALAQPEEASYASAMNSYCQRQPEPAKQQLKALADGPAGVDAMLGLALIAQIENDNSGAIDWYTKVLAKDPQNATALSYLAAMGATSSAAPTPKK